MTLSIINNSNIASIVLHNMNISRTEVSPSAAGSPLKAVLSRCEDATSRQQCLSLVGKRERMKMNKSIRCRTHTHTSEIRPRMQTAAGSSISTQNVSFGNCVQIREAHQVVHFAVLQSKTVNYINNSIAELSFERFEITYDHDIYLTEKTRYQILLEHPVHTYRLKVSGLYFPLVPEACGSIRTTFSK